MMIPDRAIATEQIHAVGNDLETLCGETGAVFCLPVAAFMVLRNHKLDYWDDVSDFAEQRLCPDCFEICNELNPFTPGVDEYVLQ